MRYPFSKILTNHLTDQWRSRLVRLILGLLPTIFATVITIPMVSLGVLQPIEFFAYNNFTNWRGDHPWDDRVMIIAIDDKSINKLGRFPWNRDLYVQLLQNLEKTEAGVVWTLDKIESKKR